MPLREEASQCQVCNQSCRSQPLWDRETWVHNSAWQVASHLFEYFPNTNLFYIRDKFSALLPLFPHWLRYEKYGRTFNIEKTDREMLFVFLFRISTKNIVLYSQNYEVLTYFVEIESQATFISQSKRNYCVAIYVWKY